MRELTYVSISFGEFGTHLTNLEPVPVPRRRCGVVGPFRTDRRGARRPKTHAAGASVGITTCFLAAILDRALAK
jgi:hypothetical protein